MSCKHERLVQEAELRCAECNLSAKSVVEALHARILTARAEGKREGIEEEQAITLAAARNFGIDLKCGSCASRFYTGFTGYPHDPSCTTDEVAHRIRALLDAPEVK